MIQVITNRGAQIGLFTDDEVEAAAELVNEFNATKAVEFCWACQAPDDAVPEDMPGRGVWYG